MDAAYLSAIAALAGSAIGGLTSFFSTWLGQNAQLKVQLLVNDKLRRQELYRDFIEQASKLYIDGMTSSTPDLSKIIGLYALISRMRIISTTAVFDEAETVVRLIVQAYPQPNLTYEELRVMADQHKFDPLKGFADACRKEMEAPMTP